MAVLPPWYSMVWSGPSNLTFYCPCHAHNQSLICPQYPHCQRSNWNGNWKEINYANYTQLEYKVGKLCQMSNILQYSSITLFIDREPLQACMVNCLFSVLRLPAYLGYQSWPRRTQEWRHCYWRPDRWKWCQDHHDWSCQYGGCWQPFQGVWKV